MVTNQVTGLSGDIFGGHNSGCEGKRKTTGVQLVEARGIAKDFIRHRAIPTTKDDLAPNVDSAKVEKLGVKSKVGNRALEQGSFLWSGNSLLFYYFALSSTHPPSDNSSDLI